MGVERKGRGLAVSGVDLGVLKKAAEKDFAFELSRKLRPVGDKSYLHILVRRGRSKREEL